MDGDIERICNLLQEAEFPSNISDVQNPSTEFLVKVIAKFLTGYSIDVNIIQSPTFQQEKALSWPPAYHEIISFINIHEAMSSICKQIFLHDFCITDITSPGPKRARRQVGLLLNFNLYTSNKMMELADNLNEIEQRSKAVQKLTQKKNHVMEAINQNACHTSKQLALEEKYLRSIEELKLRIEKKYERGTLLEDKQKEAEERRQDAFQRYGSVQDERMKLADVITGLQSRVVKSPDVYLNQMSELEKEKLNQIEKRAIKEDAIEDKKRSINQFERILSFIQQQHEKFPEVKELQQQCNTKKEVSENLVRQIDKTNTVVEKLKQELTKQTVNECSTTERDELNAQCKQRLIPLRETHEQLLREKKLVVRKIDDEQMQLHQIYLERDEIRRQNKTLDEEISQFLKGCQEIYDKEIAEEKKLRELNI